MELVMRQLEIEFFWPLTEQIPLGLDYTGCEKPKLSMPTIGTGSYYLAPTNSNISIITSQLTVDVGSTVFKLEGEPPLYRKILYKLMNIKWEKK